MPAMPDDNPDVTYPARANDTTTNDPTYPSRGDDPNGDITYPARGGDNDGAAGPGLNDPTRGSAQHAAAASNSNGHTAGIVIGVLIIIAILALGGWLFYRHYRARRQGLPSPGFNPFSDRNRIGGSGGPLGWVKGQFATMSRGRKAGGAYEGTTAGAGGTNFGASGGRRSGFRGLDPDDAWDSRVQNEADYGYEETELGLRNQPGRGINSQLDLNEDTGYDRGAYGPLHAQGRDQNRTELDDRYDDEMGRKATRDPFADPEPSLRSISPNPTGRHSGESGHAERKSVFREGNMG